MDLLIVHRHFWPSDLPYAQMLKEFVLFAVRKGYSVTVLAPCESHRDSLSRAQWASDAGVTVVSCVLDSGQGRGLLGKAFVYLKYLFWLSQRLKKISPDVVWVGSTPPIFVAALVRRRYSGTATRYIYHCQDVHPEASMAIGKIGHGRLFNWLVSVDNRNIEAASKVVVLSEDMRKVIEKRYDIACAGKISVINNFVRDDLVSSLIANEVVDETPEQELGKPAKQRPRWLFAGTLGHFQNLELLVDALLLVDENRCPEVTFLGGGALQKKLVEKVPISRSKLIRFLDPVDSATAQRMMKEFDVGIVSLAPGVINCAYPSKAINYLAAGLKIFAVLESDSELAQFLTHEGMGVVSDGVQIEQLAQDIESAFDSQVLLPQRKLCTETAKRHFNMDTVLESYENLLTDTGL